MHYSEILYRPPQEYATPLLEITQGCTHNTCRFCTMYRESPFRMTPLAIVEEDLQELAECVPQATRLYFTGGNPFALNFANLKARLELVRKYLPQVREIAMNARIDDITPKSDEELTALRSLGVTELYIGQESGDDATLTLVGKGITAADIRRECRRLEKAGILYWSTFLNGVTDRSLSHQHALNTAEVFNSLHQKAIAITSFTMFPGTPLAEDAATGHFTPVSEKERLEELLLFIESLEVEADIWTSPTSAIRLLGHLPEDREAMMGQLIEMLTHLDETALTDRRKNIQHL